MTSHHPSFMKQTPPPLKETWKLLMHSTGSQQASLRRSLCFLALAAMVRGGSLACLLPIFQCMILQNNWSLTLVWLTVMIMLMVISNILQWQAMRFDYEGNLIQCTHELRTQLGERLNKIPLTLLKSQRTGEISTTILSGVNDSFAYLITVASLMANALLTPLTIAFVFVWFDWRLGIMLLLLFPVLIPLYYWRRPTYNRGMQILTVANNQASAEILEYIQGITVMRACSCTGEKAQKLQKSFIALENVQLIGQKKGERPNLVITIAMELLIFLIVAIATALVTYDKVEVTSVAAMVILMLRFGEPLATFVLYTKVLDLMEATLHKINMILGIPPLPQPSYPLTPKTTEITFDNVSFHYEDNSRQAVSHINLHIPTHSFIAIVGESGSGKTTLTNLLMRHADPQRGGITIGNVDIRHMTSETLNQLISVVFQEAYLFHDSVLANLRMAKPTASEEEIETVARIANCHEFIKNLPQGYHTILNETGSNLSGGERQRISIARALLKNTPI